MHEIKEIHTRNIWKKGDDVIAELDIRRPLIEGVPKRVNRYYLLMEKKLIGFCKRSSRAGDGGVYKADYTVAFCTDRYISIYCDISKDGFVRARTACTWDALSGYPLPLGHFTDMSRRAIIARILTQTENKFYPPYFRTCAARIKRFYDPDNFWLDGSDIFFYYQPLTLAPLEYGVSSFLL